MSPTSKVKAPRQERQEMRFLTLKELKHLASCFPERWRNLILFTGIMGPRWSEVWAMLPSDVQGTSVLIRGTKSRTSYRRVAMPKFIQKVIADQLEHWATPDSLWPTKLGKAPQNLEGWRFNVWYPALERSGLPHLRFHDLRHTAAALAIASGGNGILVQRRLGHANISITLGTYGHLFPEADLEVAKGLDEMWDDDEEA